VWSASSPGRFNLREEPRDHLEWEAGWAPQPIWMFGRRQKYLGCAEIRTLDLSACSLFAVPAMLCRPLCGFVTVFAPVCIYRLTLNMRAETHVGLRFEPPSGPRASSFKRFLDHTQRHNKVVRTPLDEWSVRRRDLYLTTHNTHNRQTSMPQVGFENTISAGERPQIYALKRAATGIGQIIWWILIFWFEV
jgi:hypothetical protein